MNSQLTIPEQQTISELAASYRDQILEHHKRTAEASNTWLRGGLDLIKKAQETGQLILAAKANLPYTEFKRATDFLSEPQIKGYIRFVRSIELINPAVAQLSQVVPAASVGAVLAGVSPMPTGHGPQRLHESNFYSRSIKLTQTLMGDINQELKDHPLKDWHKDQLISMAAATEPIAELHQSIKSLLE